MFLAVFTGCLGLSILAFCVGEIKWIKLQQNHLFQGQLAVLFYPGQVK